MRGDDSSSGGSSRRGDLPPGAPRRLATVLDHLAANRADCTPEKCRSCVHSSACSGHAAGAPEIEDLAGGPRAGRKPAASPRRSRRGDSAAATGRRHSGHFLDDDEERLFDHRRFAASRRPLLEASTLPSECYHSAAWFERECERVFLPSWSIVGRGDEIPEAGNYLAIDTEWGGPVVVCRGADGSLHAFANVCCHRGAKVVQDGAGKASRVGLVCPYHAWTYNFDGTLKWAPGMEQVKDFDEDSVRLAPVRMQEFHGFIFVCASAEAAGLEEALGDLPRQLAPWFGPDGTAKDMVTVARREYTVDCNWKFLMENTCETYHTSTVHKGSLGPMRAKPMQPHVGDWDAVSVPSQRSIVPLPSDFQGEEAPLPPFTDRTFFVNMFPSLQINVTWDCLWWMRLDPLGVDKTHIQLGFCFPRESVALDRFPSVLERYLVRWHMAVSEDNSISLNQQRGVRSKLRVPGRFSPLEFGVHNFNNWLLARVLDQGPAWDPGQRVFTGDGELWSNDDERLLKILQEGASK